MGTKDFPPTGRCPCGSRLLSADCHRLGPAQEAELAAATIDAMRASGIDPAFVYAYERTHLIITSDWLFSKCGGRPQFWKNKTDG